MKVLFGGGKTGHLRGRFRFERREEESKWSLLRLLGFLFPRPALDDGDGAPGNQSGGHDALGNEDEVVVREGQLPGGHAVDDAVHGVGVDGGVQDVLHRLAGIVLGGGIIDVQLRVGVIARELLGRASRLLLDAGYSAYLAAGPDSVGYYRSLGYPELGADTLLLAKERRL